MNFKFKAKFIRNWETKVRVVKNNINKKIKLEIKRYLLKHYKKVLIIEFDAEWKYNVKNAWISVIQLSTGRYTFIFKLQGRYRTWIPNYLKFILNTCRFVGKGIDQDLKKLSRYNIYPNIIELHDLLYMVDIPLKNKYNVNNLIEYYFGSSNVEKNKEIAKSDWTQKLNKDQIIYASYDVYVIYCLYSVISRSNLI